MNDSQVHKSCNSAMGRQVDANLQHDGVNGNIAKRVPTSNGVSDLPFDTVEDTIEAFSMLC